MSAAPTASYCMAAAYLPPLLPHVRRGGMCDCFCHYVLLPLLAPLPLLPLAACAAASPRASPTAPPCPDVFGPRAGSCAPSTVPCTTARARLPGSWRWTYSRPTARATTRLPVRGLGATETPCTRVSAAHMCPLQPLHAVLRAFNAASCPPTRALQPRWWQWT